MDSLTQKLENHALWKTLEGSIILYSNNSVSLQQSENVLGKTLCYNIKNYGKRNVSKLWYKPLWVNELDDITSLCQNDGRNPFPRNLVTLLWGFHLFSIALLLPFLPFSEGGWIPRDFPHGLHVFSIFQRIKSNAAPATTVPQRSTTLSFWALKDTASVAIPIPMARWHGVVLNSEVTSWSIDQVLSNSSRSKWTPKIKESQEQPI